MARRRIYFIINPVNLNLVLIFSGFIQTYIERDLPLPGLDINRTHEGSECDLVLARGGQPLLAIEIKYASAPENFIITPGSEDYLIREDIRVCSLITFLQKYLP